MCHLGSEADIDTCPNCGLVLKVVPRAVAVRTSSGPKPGGAAQPWAPYVPDAQTPWDLRRVVHLHRRAGFAATWQEIRRDLNETSAYHKPFAKAPAGAGSSKPYSSP